MIDLSYSLGNLPSTVSVGGFDFSVKTDFRTWLRFAEEIKTGSVKLKNYFFSLPKASEQEILTALLSFYIPHRELPRKTGNETQEIVSDYKADGDLIYSSFWEQYHINLLDPKLELHWYEFLVLLDGLHDTVYNKVVEFRSYKENEQYDNKKYYREMKEKWRLPQPEDKEAEEDLNKFNKLFE